MKQLVVTLLCILMLSANAAAGYAQTIMNRDAIIANAVSKVSVENLKTVVDDLVNFHTRNNLSTQTDSTQGIGAAAEYLYQRASSYIPHSNGRLSVEKVYYTATPEGSYLPRPVTICNVVATIQGNDITDNRMIGVLAHYDSRATNVNDSTIFAPGANDDGSGTTCLMEMVRIISGIDIPITVKIMFVSGEEHGLLGAKHMAEVAVQENWNLIAVVNNDMIGNSNASETNTESNTVVRIFSENIPATETAAEAQIRVYNSAENDSPSRQVARYIKEVGERYVDNMTVRLMYRIDRFGRGGDHQPFCDKGFSAVRLCEINENYYRTHEDVREENGIQYGDLPYGIDFEYVRKNTGVNIASVLNLAMAPAVPQNVKLSTAGLTNYSEISWDTPSTGKAPAAYYLLMRETHQSNWERKILVNGNSIRVPYSKDNYFYAVQSIDADGHESLAVFAKGGR